MAYRPGELDYVLWKMASLSQLAAARLGNEVFRAHMENDEDTPEAIVSDVQEIFIADLREIGIFLACPTTDLFSGQDTMLWFLDIVEWLSPVTLYQTMRTDSAVVDFLRCLTDGSLTNGDLMPQWLAWLAGYKPDLAPAIEYYQDRIISSDLFPALLESLLDDLQQEKPVTITVQTEYVRAVASLFHRIQDRFTSLHERLGPIPNREAVFARLEGRIRGFEYACLFMPYCEKLGWWLETDGTRLPISQKSFYRSTEQGILVVCPMTRDYDTIRKSIPSGQIDEQADVMSQLLFSVCSGKGPVGRNTFSEHLDALYVEVLSLLKE